MTGSAEARPVDGPGDERAAGGVEGGVEVFGFGAVGDRFGAAEGFAGLGDRGVRRVRRGSRWRARRRRRAGRPRRGGRAEADIFAEAARGRHGGRGRSRSRAGVRRRPSPRASAREWPRRPCATRSSSRGRVKCVAPRSRVVTSTRAGRLISRPVSVVDQATTARPFGAIAASTSAKPSVRPIVRARPKRPFGASVERAHTIALGVALAVDDQRRAVARGGERDVGQRRVEEVAAVVAGERARATAKGDAQAEVLTAGVLDDRAGAARRRR